jgi:microcystin-dependent protein
MNRLVATAALSALGFLGVRAAFAQEQYVGEIRLFGLNFCPTQWVAANGQTMNINANPALFALYGTTYGGDGRTTFGIPNLQGRAAVGANTQQPLGALFGNSTVTLSIANLPPHRPQLYASSTAGSVASPDGGLLGTFPAADKIYAPSGSPADKAMSPNAIGSLGGGVPISTQSPSLSLTWCVATQGIFPTRP